MKKSALIGTALLSAATVAAGIVMIARTPMHRGNGVAIGAT